jgi:hypothetical protein
MKTLRSIMLGLAMLAMGGAVKANTNDNVKLTQTYAVNTYVDAMTRGRLNGLNDVLDNSASFRQTGTQLQQTTNARLF